MKTHFCKSLTIITIILLFVTPLFADITYKVEKGDTLYSIAKISAISLMPSLIKAIDTQTAESLSKL